MKHIIREVAPDCADLSYYFDDDGLTEKGGDYCYNLFIISNDGFNRFHGFNIDEYKRVMEQAEGVLNGFDDVEHPNGCFNWNVYTSYKSVMLDYSIIIRRAAVTSSRNGPKPPNMTILKALRPS